MTIFISKRSIKINLFEEILKFDDIIAKSICTITLCLSSPVKKNGDFEKSSLIVLVLFQGAIGYN